MSIYQKMYTTMFNAVTTVIEILQNPEKRDNKAVAYCVHILADAQMKCEELYLDAEE